MEIEEYEDIGNYTRKISTKSNEAQIYCDRALMQMMGVCYPEAIRLFKKALKYDENIPFALWGIAYSYGPNININDLPEDFYRKGYEASLKALKKIEYANEWEKDLINSLQFRFPREPPKTFIEKIHTIKNYRKEFKKIYEKYPNDIDIVSFYVEAIVSIHRTMIWNLDKTPTPEALEAKEILERVSKLGYHPNICHLMIHALEHHPVYYKNALESAHLLDKNVKGIAHLLHMPVHIYIYYGRYKECIDIGKRSVEACFKVKKYIGNYNLYSRSRLHDIIYVSFAAMLMGQYETALKYALIIKDEIDEKLIDMFPQLIESFNPTFFHVYIRFGKWDIIIAEEIIQNEKYLISKTVQRYARAIAYAVKGDVVASELEFNEFQKQIKLLPENALIGNNPAQNVLQIGYHMALGELFYRKKEFEIAFNHLRESVLLSDQLKFSEPWDWMQPPRHALGALLLEQAHIEESVQVYLDDLDIYPDNIWSLIGLEECYTKLRSKMVAEGHCEDEVEKCERELRDVKVKLVKAREDAGMVIKVSCFCKKSYLENI